MTSSYDAKTPDERSCLRSSFTPAMRWKNAFRFPEFIATSPFKKEGTFANKEANIFLDKLILTFFEKFVDGLIYSAPQRGSADLRSACMGKC